MTVTKADLARAVYNRHGGITTRQAMAIIDAMLETIKRRLVAGDRVHLGDIGIMEVIPSRRGRGRRPARGKSAHRLLVFRPARSLCS